MAEKDSTQSEPAKFDIENGFEVYKRLLKYALPYWRIFAFGVLGMVLFALSEPALAWLFQPLIDGAFIERDPEETRLIPLFIIGIYTYRGITGFISTYCTRWVGRVVVEDIRNEMFRHLLKMPSSYYDNTSSGILIAKLIYNVEQVAQASTNAITVLIRDSVTLIALVAYMIYINIMLTVIFLGVGPLLFLAVRYVSKRFRHLSKRVQGSVGEVTHAAEEAIEAQRVVKAFGGIEYESNLFAHVNKKNRRNQLKMIATDAIASPVIQLITASALAFVVFLASDKSIIENISAGVFISFIGAMAMLLSPIKRLTNVNAYLQKGIAASQDIFALLDEKPEKDTGTKTMSRAEGKVEFQSVCLTYNEEKGQVLSDVNLTVEKGQTVAFVGRSGSGKTSLVNLLPRFYELSSGSISIDGVTIHDLRLFDLREQISIVGQEVMLFNETIAHNIAYGSQSTKTIEQIEAAAKSAYAYDFIKEMPNGFETMVGENGVLLSGGQRQRLAIARAILKDAPILVLDEATSALDTESERYIQRALVSYMEKRTTLVIAHRLSTIESADCIVVMDKGKIVETGNHTELLARDGAYARLHQMQFKNDDDG
jgi:ATP-binding cassette, subfamily B, bacterial MsbA